MGADPRLQQPRTIRYVIDASEIWDEYSSSGRKYTRCRITNEASELPDGSYILEFADESIRTKRYYNKWELVFLPRRIRPIEAA